jgi:hypothetical protein
MKMKKIIIERKTKLFLDYIDEGKWGGEYVCFDFKGFEGCKLIIGSFSKRCPHAGIWMFLFVEKSIHSVDKFRYNDETEYRFCEFSKYLVPVCINKEGKEKDWAQLTVCQSEDEKYLELGDFDEPAEDTWLFLDVPEFIEPYWYNYNYVAQVIGKRAAYWFEHGRIIDNDDKEYLSVRAFVETYIGNKNTYGGKIG